MPMRLTVSTLSVTDGIRHRPAMSILRYRLRHIDEAASKRRADVAGEGRIDEEQL
jgi:hypothetical protein